MDFYKTLGSIFEKFRQNSIDSALIGGFALHFWGYSRATTDLDLLVLGKDRNQLNRSMQELGFKVELETVHVARYQSGKDQVDFIFSQTFHGSKIIDRACEKELLGIKLRVARAEDIIGLKVQSMVNDPLRWLREMADIENLLIENGRTLDLKLIEQYFSLFKLEKEWKEILERYHVAFK